MGQFALPNDTFITVHFCFVHQLLDLYSFVCITLYCSLSFSSLCIKLSISVHFCLFFIFSKNTQNFHSDSLCIVYFILYFSCLPSLLSVSLPISFLPFHSQTQPTFTISISILYYCLLPASQPHTAPSQFLQPLPKLIYCHQYHLIIAGHVPPTV